MKQINKKLLQKYFNGTCTKDEAKLVEAWLASKEYNEPLEMEENTKEHNKKLIWDEISSSMDVGDSAQDDSAPVIPLYKKLTRYAVAACVTTLVLVGYFYQNRTDKSSSINPIGKIDSKDLYYLTSYHGETEKITAYQCELELDGAIRMYNDSEEFKMVICASKKFMLHPKQDVWIINQENSPIHSKDQGPIMVPANLFDAYFHGNPLKKSYSKICV